MARVKLVAISEQIGDGGLEKASQSGKMGRMCVDAPERNFHIGYGFTFMGLHALGVNLI